MVLIRPGRRRLSDLKPYWREKICKQVAKRRIVIDDEQAVQNGIGMNLHRNSVY